MRQQSALVQPFELSLTCDYTQCLVNAGQVGYTVPSFLITTVLQQASRRLWLIALKPRGCTEARRGKREGRPGAHVQAPARRHPREACLTLTRCGRAFSVLFGFL